MQPMQFEPSGPNVIRAVNQRWLLKLWTQHLQGGQVPRWQAIEAKRLSNLQENLSFLEVLRDDPGALRFLIRFHGRTIQRAFCSVDGRGRYLDEILEPAVRDTSLAPYTKAVEDGLPVYTILDVTDRQGRLVQSERLVLPFARDGRTVDRLLAAFEFFCADGAFDCDALMHRQDAPSLRLSAQIEARA